MVRMAKITAGMSVLAITLPSIKYTQFANTKSIRKKIAIRITVHINNASKKPTAIIGGMPITKANEHPKPLIPAVMIEKRIRPYQFRGFLLENNF